MIVLQSKSQIITRAFLQSGGYTFPERLARLSLAASYSVVKWQELALRRGNGTEERINELYL